MKENIFKLSDINFFLFSLLAIYFTSSHLLSSCKLDCLNFDWWIQQFWRWWSMQFHSSSYIRLYNWYKRKMNRVLTMIKICLIPSLCSYIGNSLFILLFLICLWFCQLFGFDFLQSCFSLSNIYQWGTNIFKGNSIIQDTQLSIFDKLFLNWITIVYMITICYIQ